MLFSFHLREQAPHQHEHAVALSEGLAVHGYESVVSKYDVYNPACDVAVIWSWKQIRLINAMQSANKPVLVMERGFFQDRMKWCALGLNGLNGRGIYPPCNDNGERYYKHFSHLEKQHGGTPDGYWLIIGQVVGDASLAGVHPENWAEKIARELQRQGKKIKYRPHPIMRERASQWGRRLFCPTYAELSNNSLDDDLKGAACVVTYSSIASVEAIMLGVPTIAMSDVSIAYPVCNHDITEEPYAIDFDLRRQWCYDIAWRQWTLEEMASGAAVEHLKELWKH
jgi:hypothetical protein